MADRLSPEERAELDSERGYSESSAKETRLREWFSLREADGGPAEFNVLVTKVWREEFQRNLRRWENLPADVRRAKAAEATVRRLSPKMAEMMKEPEKPEPRRLRGAPFKGGGVKQMPNGRFRWTFTIARKQFFGPCVQSFDEAERQRIAVLSEMMAEAAAASQDAEEP